jgi:chorismate mutase
VGVDIGGPNPKVVAVNRDRAERGSHSIRWRTNVTVLCAIVAALVSTIAAPAASADDPNPFIDLVDAATQRLQTADPVAAFKWKNGLAVDDPARVRQVLESVTAEAKTKQIDPLFVSDIFDDQINATDAIEYARFSEWKLDPASAPTSAPDLSASRTSIDTLNHTMVNDIVLHWGSLHSPACAVDLDAAKTAAANALQLDDLYKRALSFATHSYCR